jgi:hypothetical protein
MKRETFSILVAFVFVTGASSVRAAEPMQVVSADAEYAAAHPRPVAKASGEDFPTTMDRVFGQGRWRLTGGYRSQAQENALRRQGAGTVAPGHTSLHSVGRPDAPGAYDAVVDHMAPATAAAKLKREGGAFSRVVAEGPHGGQGPHLHIELVSTKARAASSDAVAQGTNPQLPVRRRWAAMRIASAGAIAN